MRIKCTDGKILNIGNLAYNFTPNVGISYDLTNIQHIGDNIVESATSVIEYNDINYRTIDCDFLLQNKNWVQISNNLSLNSRLSNNNNVSFYLKYGSSEIGSIGGRGYATLSETPPTICTTPLSNIPLVSLFVPYNENIPNITKIYIGVTFGVVRDGIVAVDNYIFSYAITDSNILREINNSEIFTEPVSKPVDDEEGTFDEESDVVVLPSIDDINLVSALSSKMVSAYKLSMNDLNDIANFLWSDDFNSTIFKNQNSPIDNIQRVHCLPIPIQADNQRDIIIGNVNSGINSDIITKQFQEFDCGNIDVQEFYGTFLDYDTEISIVLPYIGEKKLEVNDIMNATLNLTYRVDILTGNCIAVISAKRNRNNTVLNSVLYQFSGNMSNELPLTQYTNQTIVDRNNAVQNILTNPLGGVGSVLGTIRSEYHALNYGDEWKVARCGNIGGNNGYMGVLTPYLIIKRLINIKPNNYNKYYSYPSFYTRKLNECSGLTIIDKFLDVTPRAVPQNEWEKLKNELMTEGIIL